MNAPPNKGKGKAIQWIRDHVAYEGDDCLKWPFSTVRGYGQLGYNGKPALATRLMCEFVHGPAPTPDHEAAHSCGRGHEGCTNPKHLSWKTHSENQSDRRGHGTHRTKIDGKRWTLTPEQVAEIRRLKGQVTQNALAARFGVSDGNIRAIQSGRSWKTGNYETGHATRLRARMNLMDPSPP